MRITYKSYISKNRHNTYHFRIVIPLDIRHQFNNKREIRRSLRTDSRSTAIYRARFMRVKFQEVFISVSSKKNFTRASTFIKWCHEHGFCESNPLTGMSPKISKKHKPRHPFSQEQLELIFKQDIFTQFNFKHDWQY